MLISSKQTAYLKKRFTGECGKLIFDIIEITDWFNIEGFLVTIDNGETFNSLYHDFLSSFLRKFVLGAILSHG